MAREKKSKRSRIEIGESGYPVMSEMFVPKAIFFTQGVGVHKDRLSSFELSLRDAGIEKANLVTVSSIFPPYCREISRKEGQKYIMPGQIVHCVMARQDTNEPNRLIAWRSVGNADVDNAGSVTFTQGPEGRGTEVKVVIDYIPTGGRFGQIIAKFLGRDPSAEVREGLRDFKRVMETGEKPTTEGQPRGTCSGSGYRD